MFADPTDWSFFLQTFSVERSEPFLRELAVPFRREQFPEVVRLARACLEAQVFAVVRAAGGDPASAPLVEAWARYRRAGGVLDEQTLASLSLRRDGRGVISQVVFEEYQSWVGAETAAALREWFEDNFRSGPDPAWRWPWALRLLFADDPPKVSPPSPTPLSDEERQRVESFCRRYGDKRRALELRFWVIGQAATGTLPSAWEEVLQAYPEGDRGNIHPWLGHVEECLQSLTLRREWERLRAELGAEAAARLVEWVRRQEKLLPSDGALPPEPRPLRRPAPEPLADEHT